MQNELMLDTEVKRDNRIVAGWLLYYEDRKQEYIEDRARIMASLSPRLSSTGGSRSGGPSDPTSQAGMKLAELERQEQWLELVEEVERRLPANMRIYLRIRRRYRDCVGRKGWVVAVQREYAEAMEKLTGKELEVVWVDSRRTFWVWWDRIVEYAARVAAKKGLL